MAACAQCGAVVPPEARFCPGCAAPVERRPEPAEERKLATVLFADLVGSTALADAEDPERTRAVLDRFYDAMAEEIERAGGTVEKFVGDAVMAAFGAPAALEDHAERALHAALGMQRRLRELHGDRLALRIGVNTGDVVVGRAREGSSFVTGDAVNVAARLEQAAAPGEILVGARTAAAARGAFELDEPVTVEAKGKPGGVAARRLVRALSLMRPRGVGGLRAAFVGRERELERLRAAYEHVAQERKPQLLAIVGDAGVGKTRLVREFWGWLAEQEPQPLQRTGRCLSYGHGVGYWPLAELLREHFGILDSDGPEVSAERLGGRRFLGLTLGLDAGEALHPLVARERLHDAWVDFLTEVAQERPAVVLIEDVHWAEDELCDLLEVLAARVEGPLLLLATARQELLERRPALCGARRNTSALMLETLPAGETGELLERLLGSRVPASVEGVVVERAEGNPFFVEELLATLIDRGVLTRRNGGWTCSELPEGFEVPDTVQAVLAARIDLLPPAEKAALQAASVIGRVFWTGPVYELLPGSAPDFALLEERDFVRRRAGSTIAGEREYAIKHALTRDVAYESLPKARRAQLHAAFAHWLEQLGEGGDDQASMLAHHYCEAVRPEDLDLAWSGREEDAAALSRRAVEWSRRAAALALGRYEIDEAVALLRRALEHEPDPARQAELWYEVGRASALKYDGEAFTDAMERAIELGGPSADVYAELGFQTVQRAGMWQKRPDREVVSGWIDRALELSGQGSPQRAKAAVARAQWDHDATAAAEALALAERLGDVQLRAHGLVSVALLAMKSGEMERACALIERQGELLREIADPDQRANGYLAMYDVYSSAGRFADAARAAEQLERVAADLTPHHRLHGIATRITAASLSCRWRDASLLTQRLELAVEANLRTPCPFNVMALLYAALAASHLGEPGEAERLEAKAEAIGMEGYGFIFDAPRIRLALQRGDLEAATRLVEDFDLESLEAFGYNAYEPLTALLDAFITLGDCERIEATAPRWLGPGTFVEPFALRALGVARDDPSLLERAAARFAEMDCAWHAEETRRLLAS